MRFTLVSFLLSCSVAVAQSVVASAALDGPICFDEARQRLSVFLDDAVWEWSPVSHAWAPLPVGAPGSIGVAVYAPWERRVFVTVNDQLAAFDGHSFDVLTDLPPGATTAGVRLIADTTRNEIGVLFTRFSTNFRTVHFRWDGASWQQLADLPSRLILTAAYDPVRDAVVANVLAPSPYETWEWDGTMWLLRATNQPFPSPVVFDPARQQVIQAGSAGLSGWTGSSWSPIHVANGPWTTLALAPDFGRSRVFARTTWVQHHADAWVLDGFGWAALPNNHPQAQVSRFTFDTHRGRAVLYDGSLHAEFDGERWHRVLTTLPIQRTGFAQAYDSARGHTVMFGGFRSNGLPALSTWAWDGQTWWEAATTGPTPRRDALMTFDEARQRVVLVGGKNGSQNHNREHWEWDGTSWALIQANGPFAIGITGGLGYDRVTARMIHIDDAGDTREYDGSQWALLGSGPTRSLRGRLAWNGLTQHLQGSMRTTTSTAHGEYEWDRSAAAWTAIGPTRGLLLFDETRGTLLEFGSESLHITGPTLASTTNYGTGCGGQTIRTSLTPFGMPRPGTTILTLDLRADAAFRPALIGFATTRSSVPLGHGCRLLLHNPTASSVWFTDQNGVLQPPLPLPADQSLQGFTFTAQGAVLDPTAPAGIALTQGLELTIGG